MLDKPNPTRKEVETDFKAHQEAIKNLPMVDFSHVKKIIDFVNAHQEIKSQDEANEVLGFLNASKEEWEKYIHYQDSTLYPTICTLIEVANSYIQEDGKAIDILRECISVVEDSDYYKWLFKIKSDLYSRLARHLSDTGQIDEARKAIRMSISYMLVQNNNQHYDKYAFYSFRPCTYVLDELEKNEISLSDPASFNDPVDPALFSHLQVFIDDAQDEKEKKFYQLQLEAYKDIRIRSFSRGLPLPEKTEDDHAKDPEFAEIYNPTMWGYYADSHKGICVKYVFPISITNIEKNNEYVLILRNVHYKETYDLSRDSMSFTEAFFTKGIEWKAETESRLVYYGKTQKEEKNYKEFSLPDGVIAEIYVGAKTPKEDKLRIKQIATQRQNIKIYQMKISRQDLFKMEKEEIKDINNWLI